MFSEIYDDLGVPDIGEQYAKIEQERDDLLKKIVVLENSLKTAQSELSQIKETKDNLDRNISELFKTAKAEIARKDKQNKDLQERIDKFVLMNNNSNKNHRDGYRRERERSPRRDNSRRPNSPMDRNRKEYFERGDNKRYRSESQQQESSDNKRRRSKTPEKRLEARKDFSRGFEQKRNTSGNGKINKDATKPNNKPIEKETKECKKDNCKGIASKESLIDKPAIPKSKKSDANKKNSNFPTEKPVDVKTETISNEKLNVKNNSERTLSMVDLFDFNGRDSKYLEEQKAKSTKKTANKKETALIRNTERQKSEEKAADSNKSIDDASKSEESKENNSEITENESIKTENQILATDKPVMNIIEDMDVEKCPVANEIICQSLSDWKNLKAGAVTNENSSTSLINLSEGNSFECSKNESMEKSNSSVPKTEVKGRPRPRRKPCTLVLLD